MFEKLETTWSDYGFEILVVVSLLVILIYALYRRGKQGSWTRIYRTPIRETPVYETPKKSTESKGEVECRRVLEAIFRKPFNKCRPDMLRNPVTEGENNLEIDCYNDELRLGVEYNGAQHYKYIPYFHRTRDAFNNQKYRDHIKRELCQKNGIFLIEVPYTVKVDDIEGFLIEKLQKAKYL
jgi:hypothetical protein